MAVATGDIVIDASGLPATDPYTPAGVTGFGDRLIIDGGSRIQAMTAGGFYTTAAPEDDVVTAVIEVASDQGDSFGPAIVNTSGNGWYLECRYGQLVLKEIAAGTRINTPVTSVNQALVAGDLVSIEWTESTTGMRFLHNGTQVGTRTDASITNLRAGYYFKQTDFADTGALSWAATGYGASLNLDQASLTPGGTISGSYNGYTGVPVSPLTLTDSAGNSITVPVTITDNGDGTGTFIGTMPSLPSSGASQGLLFGNVTVGLGS